MWRRVSCEQLLDTSQSLLRLRGNPIKLCGVFSLTRPQLWPKGNEVLIPQPDSGTDSALVPTRQREMSLRRPPELWEELSFLHKPPSPWNSFEERMGFGYWRRMKHFLFHPRAVGGTLKISVGLRRFRISSYPYPQQVSKVNSLWSIE